MQKENNNDKNKIKNKKGDPPAPCTIYTNHRYRLPFVNILLVTNCFCFAYF